MTHRARSRTSPSRPSRCGAGSTASAASSPRPSATRAGRRSSSRGVLGLVVHRRQPGDRRRVRHAASRAPRSATSSPPCRRSCRASPARSSTSSTLGGYLQYKYGVFFPLVVEPVVDPRPVGHARRRGAARQPRVRRRDRPVAPARRPREAVRPRPDARAGGRRRVRLDRVRRARRSRTLPGDEISVAAGVRLRDLARPPGARRRRPSPSRSRRSSAAARPPASPASSRSPASSSTATRQPVPELAPFANLTWWGWTYEPRRRWPASSTGRRSALVAVVAVVLLGDRRRGVRPPRHRRHERDPDAVHAARAASGCRGPAGRAIGDSLPPPLAWGIGRRALRPRRSAARRGSFMEQLADSPEFIEPARDGLPERRLRRRPAASCSSLFVEFGRHPGRPRRGDVRRRLGIGRDLRAARDGAGDAAQPGALGDRRRRRHARQRRRLRRPSRRPGSPSASRSTGGDVATPIVGSLVLGAVRGGAGRDRPGRRRRLRHAVRRRRPWWCSSIVTWFVQILGAAPRPARRRSASSP